MLAGQKAVRGSRRSADGIGEVGLSQLQERLAAGEVVIIDGAMGTELQRRGVPMDKVAWSAAAIATHPDTIREIHEDYIRAGADVIITNTFGAARHVLARASLGEKVAELNKRAVELAREARERAADGRPVLVAGSMSSFLPEDDQSKMIMPDVAVASYREQAEVLASAGADLIALEMMQDVAYTVYALEGALATGLPVWVGFSCRLAADGETVLFYRKDVDAPFAEAIDKVMSVGGSVAGIMHSEIDVMIPALKTLGEHWSGPVAAYPHRGRFIMPEWQFVDAISPDDYVAEARKWLDAGARIIGGCCGIGPDHIRALKEQLPARIES
jgi:S-methylmethionine-dependent homocysteine/selenocysteine methylase